MRKLAVIGATGNVGREILNILSERNFPAEEIVAVASRESLGKEVSFGPNISLKIQALDLYNFKDTDIALFATDSKIAKEFVPKAAVAGCVVIDNSSYFRMNKDVPLIVPEVNADKLINYERSNIIANPNCVVTQTVPVLNILENIAPIKRIVITTFQSVSGAGKEAMDELYRQTKGVFMFQQVEPKNFTKQIAFNIIPHIDSFASNGYTQEELKIIQEIKKIMDLDISITATCTRVPVFIGHMVSANIEFEDKIDLTEVQTKLASAEGIELLDKMEDGGYATPIDCVGEDNIFVSRIRQDLSVEHGINLCIIADNLRKGAALNAVQIAEHLIKESK